MAIVEDYKKLIDDITKEFFDFEIIKKDESKKMKIIDIILKVITFGNMNKFMTGFITTLGNKVYVPSSWDAYPLINKIEILRHERIHMKQAKKYGRLLFSFLYLMVPLPCGLAYFRKKFEMEAYEESIKTSYEYLGEKTFSPEKKAFYISQFTSANYFWMWPFRGSLEEWYDAAVEKVKLNK